MKRNVISRIEKLEQRIKPRLIETWVDLVLFADSDSTEEVELSPCLQELVDLAEEHYAGN